MFSLFKKDPIKNLQKQYQAKLEAGMNAQRNGDMRLFAKLTKEAEDIDKEIQRLQTQ